METGRSDPEIMARAQATFDLYRESIEIMTMNLRRRFPEESEEQIDLRVRAWLRERPDEEVFGPDGPPADLVGVE